MIKRFKTDDDGTMLDEHPDGQYVEYSEYAKCVKALEKMAELSGACGVCKSSDCKNCGYKTADMDEKTAVFLEVLPRTKYESRVISGPSDSGKTALMRAKISAGDIVIHVNGGEGEVESVEGDMARVRICGTCFDDVREMPVEDLTVKENQKNAGLLTCTFNHLWGREYDQHDDCSECHEKERSACGKLYAEKSLPIINNEG